MNRSVLRLVTPLVLIAFVQLACYKSYTITTEQLAELQSSAIQESVTIQTESGPVDVSATTPITVFTVDNASESVSPFNFTMNEANLIAPDYELLLFRDEITGARVQEFSKGRTIGLIVGAVLAAGGAFAAVSLLAPEDQGLSGN
jgi:hypothetical protein